MSASGSTALEDYARANDEQEAAEFDPFTEERYRQFHKLMPPQARTVLDIGCSTGRGGRVLKELDSELIIHGLDAVRHRLERLPTDVYADTVHGLSTSLPIDDLTYDVVVAGEFIEHLQPIDVDRTLSEIFRVLRIGGVLLLTTPNPNGLKLRATGGSVLGGAHVSQHFPRSLKARLRATGFNRVRLRGSGKSSRYLGDRVPILSLYGSFLASGVKR